MTKLFMSCDDYVYCCNGQYYARTREKYEFYHRYLRVFDELRLVTRCVNEETLGKSRVLLDDPKIEFVPMPFFSGPFQYAKVYFKIGQRLRNITEGCDAAIIRLPSTIAQRVSHHVIKSGIPYAMELVFDAKDALEDQGVQYTCEEWHRACDRYGIRISMDGRARCLDNVWIERFWRTIKREYLYLNLESTVGALRRGIARYMDYYNNRRCHQSLSHRAPGTVYAAAA